MRLAVIAPVGWRGYALVDGALEDRNGNDSYAYPFMNAQVHGDAVALFRCAVVASMVLALSFGALTLDRRLRGAPAVSPAT